MFLVEKSRQENSLSFLLPTIDFFFSTPPRLKPNRLWRLFNEQKFLLLVLFDPLITEQCDMNYCYTCRKNFILFLNPSFSFQTQIKLRQDFCSFMFIVNWEVEGNEMYENISNPLYVVGS